MRVLKWLLCLLLLGLFTTHAHTQSLSVLALGDSYTIGESVPEQARWPNQLKSALGEKGISLRFHIVAKTGWRTDDLLAGMERVSDTATFDKVSILIGVNNQYQGRSIDQFEKELESIISAALQKCGNDTSSIFFISIPDYGYSPFGETLDTIKISEELDRYNAVTQMKAHKLGVPVVDVTSISRSRKGEMIAKDGLHPSQQQYAAWVDAIVERISFTTH
ncbi:MAG: SGNH/GDSL hydrolase family protein [Cryomorphaceae bacterium]